MTLLEVRTEVLRELPVLRLGGAKLGELAARERNPPLRGIYEDSSCGLETLCRPFSLSPALLASGVLNWGCAIPLPRSLLTDSM